MAPKQTKVLKSKIIIITIAVSALVLGTYQSAKQVTIETVSARVKAKRTSLFNLLPLAKRPKPRSSPAAIASPLPAPSAPFPSQPPPQPTSISFNTIFDVPVPTSDQMTRGIPLCPSHDDKAWHALYDPVRNCHYDHEHKDNPSRVNDLFGPVGALYGGQTISYPWQTWSGLDFNLAAQAGKMENEMKHTGYLWLVRRRSDFKPDKLPSGEVVRQDTTCYTKEAENCITDFRVQVHSIFSQVDANVRFHSYWIEARGCKVDQPNLCGTIKTGGVVDYGHLLVDDQPVALPQDSSSFYGLTHTTGRRVHGGDQTRVLGGDAVWYAQVFLAGPSMLGTAWGPIDKNNTTATHFYCTDPIKCKKNNASILEAEVVEIAGTRYALARLDGTAQDLDGVKDGRISYKGFTDRFGNIVANCGPIGIDCIPLEINTLPTGYYQYRDTEHGLGNGGLMNYDTAPGHEYWIQYPSFPYVYSHR